MEETTTTTTSIGDENNKKNDASLPPISVCVKCKTYLFGGVADGNETSSSCCCLVCLGLWQSQQQQGTSNLIVEMIQQAAQPYGGISLKFSNQFPPTVALSGHFLLRFQLASRLLLGNAETTTTSKVDEYMKDLKQHVKNLIVTKYPLSSTTEEGCLCTHVIITPASCFSPQPPSWFQPIKKKRIRKRFRGLPEQLLPPHQGGDARVNFEEKLCGKLWNATDTQTAFRNVLKSPTRLQELMDWCQQPTISSSSSNGTAFSFDVHATVWRRPFYITGMYTKSRRDISQTPMFVPNDFGKNKMKRLGVSSVEEQVCPSIQRACGGISQQHNSQTSNVLFGMVKFHASGREDYDVRMLLPLSKNNKSITGRPFCVQVVDAHSIPTAQDLNRAQCEINHTASASFDCEHTTGHNNNEPSAVRVASELSSYSDNDICSNTRRYGRNPMGVDVFGLQLTNAASFKTLQAETESKVKHYACTCWCFISLKNQEHLEQSFLSHNLPLELKQSTPIRVLHRRANTLRVRHVLTLQPTFVDAHHFRLRLSTTAGAYVKEFVHGDLGRTVPSISSLLGSKTDILELDCEGIEM